MELATSETVDSASVASYLDLLLTRDESNNFSTKLYDKHNLFSFTFLSPEAIFHLSLLMISTHLSLSHMNVVAQIMLCFLLCHGALVIKFLSQRCRVDRLSNTQKKSDVRHIDLAAIYKRHVCKMIGDTIN